MSTLPIIFVVAACAGVWLLVRLLRPYFCRRNGLWAGLRHLPHSIPLIGLDLVQQQWKDFQAGQYSEGLRRRHVSFGRTFSASILGKRYIYTIEPQNILTITKHGACDFKKSTWASEAAKYIGKGILLNEGEAWSRSRAMLKPIFRSKVANEPKFMEPHIKRLTAQMMILSETEGKFEFHRLADMFLLDIFTEFLLGKSTATLEIPRSPEGEDAVQFLMLVRSFDEPSASFIAVGMLARIKMLFSGSELNKTVAGMKDFFKRKLADLITSIEDPASREGPWSAFRPTKAAGISDDQVQAELQNIFFASWDTTSALLANTIYALLRHQHVQQRLREEISTLRDVPPTKQQLIKMKYLRLVVDESEPNPPPPLEYEKSSMIGARYSSHDSRMAYHATSILASNQPNNFCRVALRLYSPVTSHSRTAKVDTTLPRGGGGQGGQGEIFVRAGTTVLWSTYSLNRDPRWYGQDWAEFRPERWLSLSGPRARHSTAASAADGETNTETDNDRGRIGGSGALRYFFMPFGGSSNRACPGQHVAEGVVMYAIVRILQEFPHLVDEAEHTPFREAKSVSFCPADGVWVSVDRGGHREVGPDS